MAEEQRTDILMQTDPAISGDTIVKEHDDWIRCTSCGFSSDRSVGPIEDRRLGGASFSGLEITRKPDIASADLFAQHLKSSKEEAEMTVTIDFVESGGKVNYQVKLTKAIITSYSLANTSGIEEETLTMAGEELTVKVGDTERIYNYGTRELT